ncbi:MAG: filamentous hemagglutinin N-terminal domain-containing protein [Gammaproteobacteria bacterium]|nr:filamentous hemagglutinin N-terminal domain-containing protein [Gammaproteobacteria bacterium]
MTTIQGLRKHSPVILTGGLLFSLINFPSFSYADVTATSTQGNLNSGVTAGPNFDITGGTRLGSNLFHSFDSFNLTSSQIANFINDSGLTTTNILSRVTGGPSSIDGTIQTTGFSGANLYLINPAGIIFGATAQLNVEGSFHATTADYINLGGNGIFYADVAQGSVLSTSSPSAFGFLNNNPGSIEVHTGGIDFNTYLPTALLEVPQGETLSLVGGQIDLGTSDFSTSGFLLAPAGTVNLVSVASAGEVTIGTPGNPISADGFALLGDINISGGSIVDASNIYIRGGNLVIDESVLVPGGFAFELSWVGYSPLPDGGEVNIKVTDNLIMTGTDLEFLTLAAPGIFVYTGDFFDISPAAKVPDINIDAGSLSISGVAGISINRNAPGAYGNVVINANDVTIESGGSIALRNAYVGDDPMAPGPSLTINAQTVNISGDGSASAFGFEGIAAQGVVNLTYLDTQYGADVITANGGNISINATDSLSVTGLGQITTDNRVFGNAGDITIKTGDLQIAGTGNANSAVIGSQSAFAGNGGNILINTTGDITVTDGGRISSSALGSGDAGDITLTAAGAITLDGEDSRIVGGTIQPSDNTLNNLFLEVFYWYDFNIAQADSGNPNASLMEVLAYLSGFGDINIPGLDLIPGNGGAVTINTPTLIMNAGTRIETSTGWEGNAGSVTVNVGSLFVNDGARISSRSGIEFLDGTVHIGPGNGGSVNINATDTITISGAGSEISTGTFGEGHGGDVLLNADNAVKILNGGLVAADSGGTLAGQELSGTGLAGDITINAGNEIKLVNGTISTRAVTADGGNITLMAPKLIYLEKSDITTSVESGIGGGGNIDIDPDFVILKESNILANAFGGPGGNITIVAGNFIATPDSIVDASSALGIDGTVNISSPDEDVSEDLVVLPDNYLDVTGLISEPCGTSTGASSLVDAGPGGRTVDPDGYLPSFVATTNYNNDNNDGDKSASSSNQWWLAYAINPESQTAQISCAF